MTMRAACLLPALVLLPLLQLGAQRPTLATLVPGDTIKVWAVGPSLNGRQGLLASFRADTLTLGAMPNAGSGAQVAVPYRSLRRVDVVRGRGRSVIRTIFGGVLGGAAGMAIGIPAGVMADCDGSCGGDGDGIRGAIVGMFAGAVVGGTVGGAIGARKRTRWVAVRLTP